MAITPKAREDYTVDDIRWKIAMGHYRSADTNADMRAFGEDLEAVFETRGHPKAVAIFGLAWQYGHADGFYEVLSYYMDLVELVSGPPIAVVTEVAPSA